MKNHQKDISLPIKNRSYAWIKAVQIYALIIIAPLFVSFNNPTSFNLYFAAIFIVSPLLPIIYYLRKNNIKSATLKSTYIEVKLNGRKLNISFLEIDKVTQMIALWVGLQPGLTNVYEIRLKSKREFGNCILLEIKSNINPTEEHIIINELKHRVKTGGNIN
jgi:flagellar biosynthesis protein FliR